MLAENPIFEEFEQVLHRYIYIYIFIDFVLGMDDGVGICWRKVFSVHYCEKVVNFY